MPEIERLLENNRQWAQGIAKTDPEYFPKLSKAQKPEYLWIGCADSRVPASQITGLEPGQLFEQRNVANLVVHTDLNCLSVMQYAVEVLKVQHIIVCGHYGCGGVAAALQEPQLGLIENWLRHIQDVRDKHRDQLDALGDFNAKHDRLCELNVLDQVVNVCRTTIVRDAWSAGQEFQVHGWIYRLSDGLLKDLSMQVASTDELAASYDTALAAV